jgi:hypothetical protein
MIPKGQGIKQLGAEGSMNGLNEVIQKLEAQKAAIEKALDALRETEETVGTAQGSEVVRLNGRLD